MSLSKRGLLEVSELSRRARSLANGSQRDRKQADVILSQIKAINEAGVSTTEAREVALNELMKTLGFPEVDYEKARKEQRYRRAFKRLVQGGAVEEFEMEVRDLASGSQTIAYSTGSAGGYMVPQDVYDDFVVGMSAISPWLDPNVCTVLTSSDGRRTRDGDNPGGKYSSMNPDFSGRDGGNPLRPIVCANDGVCLQNAVSG
jgi:HK97 family phage major capsid protein